MLVINYNGKKPAQRNYEYCVVGNSDVDTIKFVLQSDICAEYDLDDLTGFDAYVKIQSAGKEYIDKISVGSLVEDNNGVYYIILYLTKKMTHWKNISLQLQFEIDEGNIVAQTEIVSLTLSGNIPADETMDEEYPYAIQQVEGKTNQNTKDIEELKAKGDTVILTTSPDEYENENGLKKIIRKVETNGSVEKSYFIDKIHHESTLVKCEPSLEENGVDLTHSFETFINDLGHDQFYEIFGDNAEDNDLIKLYSIYYNKNSEITKGVKVGSDDFSEYGVLNLINCTPNKVIRVVVGKYFEYNEQGEKVFDEHCAIFSGNFAENPENEYREITEERQEFKLKTEAYGNFYFDSNGGELGFGRTRFILYEIKTGEPAHDEYKARKIGGGNYLPTFKQSDKVQVLYDYYLEHKDEFDDGKTLNFAILGDDNEWGSNTVLAFIIFDDENVYFAFDDWGGNGYRDFNKNEILEETILYLLNNSNHDDYAYAEQLPQEWYGTQAQYDEMSSHDENIKYYIYEDE